MQKQILITRPQPEAIFFQEKLAKIGCLGVVEPMLIIQYNCSVQPELTQLLALQPQATIITSKNAIRALAQLTPIRNQHLVTTGVETANLACDLGFANIATSGDGKNCSAKLLAKFIIDNYDPGAGLVLYLSTKIIAGNIEQNLINCGYDIRRILIYHANATNMFSLHLQGLIRTRQLIATIFCSTRTAEIFKHLLYKYGLQDEVKYITAYCLSENIARTVASLPWKKCNITNNIDLMIEQIGKIND